MNKFNKFVEYILEQDDISKSSENLGQVNGEHIVKALIQTVPELGNLQKDMENKLLKNPSRRMLTLLNRRIDRIEDIQEIIREVDNEIEEFNNPKVKRAIEDLKKPEFGKDRGTFDQSSLEQAIYTIAADWKRGTLLKKLEMLGRGAKGLFAPTSSGSTGVFA